MADADCSRLIEFAFPLKQASLDSVHEKNVRHGHISTLHIWPARRPLAACRAALIATLLPDPGAPEGRQLLCEKIAGKVVKKIEKKKMPGGSQGDQSKGGGDDEDDDDDSGKKPDQLKEGQEEPGPKNGVTYDEGEEPSPEEERCPGDLIAHSAVPLLMLVASVIAYPRNAAG